VTAAEKNRPGVPVATLEAARNPLAGFRRALEAREMAPGSIRLYLSALGALEREAGPVHELGAEELRAWFARMKEAGLAPSTRSTRLAAVREFFGWAVAAGVVTVNPFQGQKEFSVRRKDTASPRVWRGMEKATLKALAAYMDSPLPEKGRSARLPDGRMVTLSPVGVAASEIRDRALVWLLLGSGMRQAEAASLLVGDLEEQDHHIIGRVLGKGGKERPFVLGLAATMFVNRWLKVRDTLLGEGPKPWLKDDHLFVTDAGTAFHPKKVWQVVTRVAKTAGVRQRLSPHSFRHARADELLEKSKGDLALVAETLGHSSLETTRGYLAKNPALLKGRLAAIGGLD
jgi:site-specific recombinase XerD